MGVAEACDNGHSALFSPTGSCIAPAALSLSEGIANAPLARQNSLFWVRGRVAGATATAFEAPRLNL
eukprot:9375870-Pyramimonas_sp.AAC.1